MLLLVITSFFVGIFNTPDITRRHITDLLMPLMFFFKIVIFRNLWKQKSKLIYFRDNFLPKYIRWTFLSGVILLSAFYILVKFFPMYLGLTPNFYPYIFDKLIRGSYLYFFVAIIFTFLSGKRAMLAASFLVTLIYLLFLKGNKIITIVSISIIIIISVIILSSVDLNESSAYRKYKWTFKEISKFSTEVDLDIVDLISGGRIAEVKGIVKTMSWYDYIFGKGVGFTYILKSKSYEEEEEHANAHFSPISIISKYGIIFYFIFSIYVIRSIIKSRSRKNKKDMTMTLFLLYVLVVNIDFLFAYGVFTNKLYPIALAYLNR